MANVLLTYDIRKTSETIHTELKNRLIQHYGYSQVIRSDDNRTSTLPNTTLTKSGITRQAAEGDFLSACREVRATWEKYITAEYTSTSSNNQ